VGLLSTRRRTFWFSANPKSQRILSLVLSFMLIVPMPMSVANPDLDGATAAKSELSSIKEPQIKEALKECLDSREKSALACNEDTSPFAQAAQAALAMLPMLMQKKNEGQKVDCNKVEATNQQAAQQIGQGSPGCGGQPPGGGGGDKGGGDKGGGNNMAKDCGGKAGDGKSKCGDAKKKIASIKKTCEKKPPGEKEQCKADADKGEKMAGESEQANSKMGSINMGQIMQMLAQLLCQQKKAQECQKDVCAAPGQLKFNPATMSSSNKTGSGKVLTDDEGCMVDCNVILSSSGVSDSNPAHQAWVQKVNARIAKFKPLCECEKTPGLPGCGSNQQQQQPIAETKKKDKSNKLVAEGDTPSNSSDKTIGAEEPGSSVSAAGGGGGGTGGGAGITGGGGKGEAKDKPRGGAPPGPPGVNNGYEGGGGGSPSKGSNAAADEPLGKYSKYLPGRKPTSEPDAGLQITGAGGKSIWEKVSDAYRIKASSLVR